MSARLLLILAAFALLAGGNAVADDRDLLKINVGNPYLFILLDTSASMNLTIGADTPTLAYGDDPNSRIYGAKEALFKVLKPLDDISIGFATFNQNRLRAPHKHWLYYVSSITGAGWPATLGWPILDDGLTTMVDTDDDGLPDSLRTDIDGDVMVFGKLFEDDSGTEITVAGSCEEPLLVDDAFDRQKLNAFAKLGSDGSQATSVWIRGGSPATTYFMTFTLPERPDHFLGKHGIRVHVHREILNGCLFTGSHYSNDFHVSLDDNMDDFLVVDDFQTVAVTSLGHTDSPDEVMPGFWNWADARADVSCGSSHPFSGKGWESNYDGPVQVPEDPDYQELDQHLDATGLPFDPPVDYKYNPMTPGARAGLTDLRELDSGDMLPFDWDSTNKVAFLQRLAPNWTPGGPSQPDFGIAGHLTWDAEVNAHVPKAGGPIIARGKTPLAKAINDFRCWYMGGDGPGGADKCKNSAFFDAGWANLACTLDSDFGCRKPFLIIISDGEDNCPGENPTADVGAMFSNSGVRTWALNVGDANQCKSGNLHSIVTPGKGDCVDVADRDDLKNILEDILDTIREETRSFASAAVPTIQTTVDQQIYLTNFRPLRDKSVWDGHLLAFKKPLPLKDGKPDTTHANFLWDAGTVLESQVNAADPLALNDASKRRVFFTEQSTAGKWAASRHLLETDGTTPDSIRYDLWRALELIPQDMADDALPEANETEMQTAVDAIMNQTFALKSAILASSTETVEYVLGDIFHSTPIVIGSPSNPFLFAADARVDPDDPSECKDDNGAANANTGYRCYARRMALRRKVIVAGSNDGMVHAFNAGIYDETAKKFSTGTGHELWAYTPRSVLPEIKRLATSNGHRYTVDGTISATDAFIDPVDDGGGFPNPDDRQWRTVLIGGLREGGLGYYALDLTLPDPVDKNADGEFIPEAGPGSPDDAIPQCIDGGSGCGPSKYPALLWEFNDTTANHQLASGLTPPDPPVFLDEDNVDSDDTLEGNGLPDLGDTWSKPDFGRILICKAGASDCSLSGDLEERQVIVFGGGMDPENKEATLPERGHWIYIVDVETGFALYKRQLLGAVPSEPAAVDIDQDGLLDRIYVGTTAGYLYRIDVGPKADGNYPKLESESVPALDLATYDVLRIPRIDGDGDPIWTPKIIFDANFDGSTPLVGERRPIYFRPSVLFVAKLGTYALAFGTGDREDLWASNRQEGRFYVFVDGSNPTDPTETPRNEGSLQRITVDETTPRGDLLQAGDGWYLVLDPNERVVTDSFSLSGITVYSSFQPDVALVDDSGNPISDAGSCGDNTFMSNTDNFCSKTGNSRLFVVNTTNGSGLLKDTVGNATRYRAVANLVSQPYTEHASSLNPPSAGDPGDPPPDFGKPTAFDLEVMETLKSLFPSKCRFANYRIDVKTIAADTSIERIAAIPVCLIEKNWKEF